MNAASVSSVYDKAIKYHGIRAWLQSLRFPFEWFYEFFPLRPRFTLAGNLSLCITQVAGKPRQAATFRSKYGRYQCFCHFWRKNQSILSKWPSLRTLMPLHIVVYWSGSGSLTWENHQLKIPHAKIARQIIRHSCRIFSLSRMIRIRNKQSQHTQTHEQTKRREKDCNSNSIECKQNVSFNISILLWLVAIIRNASLVEQANNNSIPRIN